MTTGSSNRSMSNGSAKVTQNVSLNSASSVEAAVTNQDSTQDYPQPETEKMMEAVKTLLEGMGEDPEREGLRKTPQRVAEAMQFLTQG